VLFRHGLHAASGPAATAGLLWYGTLVIVSMLGAPIVAVGQRAAHHKSEAQESAIGPAA